MNKHTLLPIALIVSVLSFAGCYQSRTSAYPDHSVNTARHVDDIQQNARDQKDAVDAEAARLSSRMDFDEQQIREQYKAQRQTVANAIKKEATDRDAEIRGIEIQAQHDKDVIDAEVADSLKTSPREEAAEIRADAESRKSEIDNQTTTTLAPIASNYERNKARHIQRGLEIDRDELRAMSALEQRRSEARDATNDQKLKIDQWTNEELAKVATASSTASR